MTQAHMQIRRGCVRMDTNVSPWESVLLVVDDHIVDHGVYLDRNEGTRAVCKIVITTMLAVPGWTDVDYVAKKLLPVMECVFRMSTKEPPRGSQQWIQLQLREIKL